MTHLDWLPNWLRKENLHERKVFVTYEAIYDIVDAEEHIFYNFGDIEADLYHDRIISEIKALATNATMYRSSGFMYRGYKIYKKPFSPAIVFWIVKDDEVHVLRVPREEYNWQKFFEQNQDMDYTYPATSFIQ